MKKSLFLLVLVLLVACGETDALPAPDSDSRQSYKLGSTIPVDDNVYLIIGRVVGDVASLTRQESSGSLSGSTYSGYGSLSGSFYSETTGKGFVRLFVHSATPETANAPPERIIVIKTTDSKVTILLPGDVVEFKCRRQYEAVAAVRDSETFDRDKLGTWELDYCRMTSPVIRQEEEKK